MMKHTLSLEEFRAKTAKIAGVDSAPLAHIPRKAYLLGR
jgi:hypothetical protein